MKTLILLAMEGFSKPMKPIVVPEVFINIKLSILSSYLSCSLLLFLSSSLLHFIVDHPSSASSALLIHFVSPLSYLANVQHTTGSLAW